MLIRLLVAVLTLVGPLPLPVCTCAAAHEDHVSNSPGEPGHSSHESSPTDENTAARTLTEHAPCDGSNSTRHDRDCPVACPKPFVRAAIPHAPSTFSGDFTLPLTLIDGPPATTALQGLPLTVRVSKIPLYLTLLSLRN